MRIEITGATGAGEVGVTAHESRAPTLAERFEAERAHLVRVAYGHLGSLAEAEDVVQDAWLRLQRVDPGEIRDLRAWLTTTVSRLALDALRSARVRREAYVGPWLPEPLVRVAGNAADPAEQAALDESVGLALLVVLESLSAAERVAFVLHDVFGYEFERIAEVLGTTVGAARQHASRARKAVESRRPRFPASPRQQREVVGAFVAAAEEGDMDALLELLDPGVVMNSDGGGVVPTARYPLEGADRIARATVAIWRKSAIVQRLAEVNGLTGLVIDFAGVLTVMSFTIDDGRIVEIDVIRNPDKLKGVVL
jgi:RNA polymerase sigma-70 factor (ECF subfamily)